MKSTFNKTLLALALTASMGQQALANTTADHNKEIIGYITNWEPWKSTNAGYPAAGVANHLNVDMQKFTILNYSFFGVAVDGSLHSGDLRNKNIYKEGEVQQPGELLMSDIYSSWDYHLVFGELAPAHQLTDEAIAQGFTASGTTWTHEGYGLSGSFPIPVKKPGGKPGILEHAQANGVKVMASIGGWSMCKHFPEMAADPVKRARFIEDAKQLIQLGFDGIDLDWEYPGPYSGMNFTGTEADYGNFLTLVKEIRAAIGPDKLITAAFSADTRKLEGFDWPELDKYMDHYNMMSYDYNGGWSNIAGHNSPLYDYPGSEAPLFNWDTLAQWMLNKGIDRNKINMGMAFYGRGVETETPAGLNAPTIKKNVTVQPDGPISTASDYTHWKQDVYDGTPNYFFIEQNKAGWTQGWDDNAKAPYRTREVNGKGYFVSYDDERSIGDKAQYVNDYGLGGAIVWTVHGDLECTGGVTAHSGKLRSCANVNQPLANKINEVFATGAVGSPVVTLTSPAAGEVFAPGSDIGLSADASDPDGSVSSVEFLANGVSIGVDSTAPYSVLWTNVPAGSYNVVAKATDDAGNVKETPKRLVAVNDDHLKPVVSYTGPSGDVVMDPLGAVQLTADASSSASALTGVTFNVNNQVVLDGVLSGGSYSASYNAADYGVHNVVVTATNAAGYSQTASGSFNLTVCDGVAWDPNTVYTTEQVIYENKLYKSKWWNKNQRPDSGQAWQYIKDCGGPVNPDNQAPTLANLAPAGGSFAAGTKVDLSVDASDADGSVDKVEFYVNNALVSADSTAPYQATFASNTAGDYTLKAVATDNLGASAEVSSTFTLTAVNQDLPPSLTITNPANGIEFDVGSVVSLSADASDAEGSVTDVVFELDGAVLATDATAPYSVDWTAARAGSYQLTVTATDNVGNQTAKSVTFVVKEPTTGNCTADAWSASKVYNGGDRASASGKVYEAKWWTQGEDPTQGANEWYVWFVPDECK